MTTDQGQGSVPREHRWLLGAALEPLRGKLFLRVADIAQLTDADPRTVRRAIDLGQIEAVRLGDNTIRIPAAPFWQTIAGLDPVTLLPLSQQNDEDASEVTPEVSPRRSVPSTDPAA